MNQPSDAKYLRQRAQSSRMAAFIATDVCARSAHARMATAYEIRLQQAEALPDTKERVAVLDLIGAGSVAVTESRR